MLRRGDLVPGNPRIGWLIDGDDSTPSVAAMLEDTGDQIVLTLPTKGMAGHSDPYARWFHEGVHYADDPDQLRYRYQPPRVMMLQDQDGTVVLVGCRADGHSENFRAGAGRVVANFAVLRGGNLKYHRLNGMRSEIPALARWSGLFSVRKDPETDSTGRVQRLVVTLEAPKEGVRLARSMNLTMRPTWRTSYTDNIGTLATSDLVQLETTSKRPVTWEDHLRLHEAMRELLLLSAWRRFGYRRLEVNRGDDPERVLSGKAMQARWAEVVTHRLRKHEAWSDHPNFLFAFDDIGLPGVRRWLRMRERFARAIEPVVNVGDGLGMFVETAMLQTGIALEALGYQIELDRGGGALDNRRQLPFREALKAILSDMTHVPLADSEDWITRVRDCYMGVKHADNAVPHSLVLANTMRESLLVIRLWLAKRLGAKDSVVSERIRSDPLSRAYVMAN